MTGHDCLCNIRGNRQYTVSEMGFDNLDYIFQYHTQLQPTIFLHNISYPHTLLRNLLVILPCTDMYSKYTALLNIGDSAIGND
jgi:hypothetical protein